MCIEMHVPDLLSMISLCMHAFVQIFYMRSVHACPGDPETPTGGSVNVGLAIFLSLLGGFILL